MKQKKGKQKKEKISKEEFDKAWKNADKIGLGIIDTN